MSTWGHRVRGWVEMGLGWASSTVSSAVLLREAARTSRRWQTYAARLGFSGVLIGGLLMAIWAAVAAPFSDPAQLGWLGRGLFVGVADTVLCGSVVDGKPAVRELKAGK